MGCTFALTRPFSASTTVLCTGQCLCTGSLYMRWYASGLHADVRSMLLTIVSIAGWAVTTQTIFTKTLPLTVSVKRVTCADGTREEGSKGGGGSTLLYFQSLPLLLSCYHPSCSCCCGVQRVSSSALCQVANRTVSGAHVAQSRISVSGLNPDSTAKRVHMHADATADDLPCSSLPILR